MHLEEMEVDTEMDPAPAGGSGERHVEMDIEDTGRNKREAEQPVEELELEAEMECERASGQLITLDLLLMDDAGQSVGPVLWSLEAGPGRAVATSPGLFKAVH